LLGLRATAIPVTIPVAQGLPHRAIVEFVAAVSRPRADLDGQPLLPRSEA